MSADNYKCPLDNGYVFVPELSDEFDGNSLDGTKWLDWNPTFTGRRAGFMFARNNVSVSDGCLRLKARLLNEDEKIPENLLRGYDTYATSIVKSKAKAMYGYYECRAKTMAANVCNAFWLYDPHSEDFQRKFTPGDISEEIDIFELTSRKDYEGTVDSTRTLFNTVHGYLTPYLEAVVNIGKKPLDNYHCTTKVDFDFCDDWHTYGLLWTEKELVWYFDGREVFRRVNDVFHRPLHITFDCEIMYGWFGIPDPKDLPAEFSVEYFRFWRP